MKRVLCLVFVWLMFCSGVVASSHASKGSAKGSKGASKASCQSAMLKFIAKNEDKNGKTDLDGVMAVFDYLHAETKEIDGLVVSCADFKAEDGVYDVDYYVDSKCKVVKVILHKKNGNLINKDITKTFTKGSHHGMQKGSHHEMEKEHKGSAHEERKGS